MCVCVFWMQPDLIPCSCVCVRAARDAQQDYDTRNWTQRMRQKLAFKPDLSDGSFWMSFEDFVIQFSVYCALPPPRAAPPPTHCCGAA